MASLCSHTDSSETAAVGKQAATGACWTIIFSLLGKVVSLGSQIALGWILWPEEFGLVAMAFAIMGPVSLLTSSHLTAPLIGSSQDFDERAGQVFWLSMGLNLFAASLLVCAAPVAAHHFREPRVEGLIWLLAISLPITALPLVYAAKLYRELRFRQMAAIHFGQGLIQSGGTILLAVLGFGASSLVLPLIFSALFSLTSTRLLAGSIRLKRPQPNTWFTLLVPVGWLMLHSFFTALLNSGPNFVLGLKHNAIQTGIYFWGYSLSSQIGFVLAVSLQNVVFPSLARLNDDSARQQQAIQKACRTLMMIVPPLGFLQILLAEPLIQLCFHERWWHAVPVVQWLSLTLVTLPLSVVATSVCLARQQYRRLALMAGISAAVTILATAVGSRTANISNIAMCVSFSVMLGHLIYGFAGVYGSAMSLRNYLELFRVPLAFALPCALAAWLICKLVPDVPATIKVLLITAVAGGGYAVLIRRCLPELLNELSSRLQHGAFTRVRSANQLA